MNINVYQHIKGPSKIEIYKIDNKTVFFFYDIHAEPNPDCQDYCSINEGSCIWIDKLLEEYFLNTDNCIDFLVETTSFLQLQDRENIEDIELMTQKIEKFKISPMNNGLSRIRRLFADCLGPIKEGCSKYKTVRFHNIEFRRFIDPAYQIDRQNIGSIFAIPLVYMFKDFRDKISRSILSDRLENFSSSTIDSYVESKSASPIDENRYDSSMKQFLEGIHNYGKILDCILEGDMDTLSNVVTEWMSGFDDDENSAVNFYVGRWTDKFTPDRLKKSIYMKINKQISAFDEDMQNKIKEYIRYLYSKLATRYINKIDLHMKDIEDKPDQRMEHIHWIVIWLKLITSDMGVILFDAYTLPRLLKTIYVYPDSDKILVYAGGEHVNNYRQFIDRYITGAETVFTHGDTTHRNTEACIDFSFNDKKYVEFIKYLMGEMEDKDVPTKCAVNF